MKKVNFVLKSNGNILYNENVQYKVNNNYINFRIDSNEFKICIMEKLHFIKETEEDIFEIKMYENETKAIYTLKSHNISFEVKTIEFEYTFRDNIYNIKYNIESDPDCIKEIILMLD